MIAAQSIGEPGTQLHDADFPHRRRGVADRGAKLRRGQVGRHGALHPACRVSNAKGRQGRDHRSSEVTIVDDNSRERERYKVPYGAALRRRRRLGARRQAASPSGTYHRPIITEYAGTVKFKDVEEGATVAKQIDDVTGLSSLV